VVLYHLIQVTTFFRWEREEREGSTKFKTKTRSWIALSICFTSTLIKFTWIFLIKGEQKARWTRKSTLGKRKVRGEKGQRASPG
jgi:nicotinamide riboside transporter PnuC